MDISNKTLAVLLLIAIVVSVGGAMINIAKLTELTSVVPVLTGIVGYGSYERGTVNITLSSQADLNVSVYQIDFGAGYVTGGASARLQSNGTTTNWSGAGASTGLTLENIGNVNLTVNKTSSDAASTFIGGTSPTFGYNTSIKEAAVCSITNLTAASGFTEVTTATQKICTCMQYASGKDELYVDVRVLIPEDAPTGAKNATITFVYSEVAGSCD